MNFTPNRGFKNNNKPKLLVGFSWLTLYINAHEQFCDKFITWCLKRCKRLKQDLSRKCSAWKDFILDKVYGYRADNVGV